MAIRIITDSGADYSSQEIEKRQITLIPMSVTIGNVSYADGIDITKEEFYELLKENKDFPKTASPSPAAFLDCFEDAKEAGDDVIAILISGKLSGTFQNAVLAKDMAEYENIYLIDSCTATLCMRVLVDRAVKMRDQGHSVEEIVTEIESLKGRVQLYAGLDTLEYLAKGGRISATTAAVGNLASIKPIIHLDAEGAVELVGKQMGLRHACKFAAKCFLADELDLSAPLYFIYSEHSKNCHTFLKSLAKQGFEVEEAKMRGIGPVIGTHIGPGAFGIVYVAKSIEKE